MVDGALGPAIVRLPAPTPHSGLLLAIPGPHWTHATPRASPEASARRRLIVAHAAPYARDLAEAAAFQARPPSGQRRQLSGRRPPHEHVRVAVRVAGHEVVAIRGEGDGAAVGRDG